MTRRPGSISLKLLTVIFILAYSASALAEWPQWGGPNRNFTVETQGLSSQWPANGPKRLWSRALGDGYSTIAAKEGNLYTMYRDGNQEVIIALAGNTGKTLWEFRYDAPFVEGMDMEFGTGPHSTPLVTDNHIYAVGVTAKFHCLNRKTGERVWKRDLMAEFGASHLGRGYSASPLAYNGMVILPIGGAGKSIMAFNQTDGSVIWQAQNFRLSHASPFLIRFVGKDQLVAFMGGELAGLDPNDGRLLWSHPHKTEWDANISMPCFDGKNRIFCSAAYGSGSRVIKLTEEGGKVKAEQLWYNNKVQIHHGNVARIGDYVYGSSGDFGPAFFVCVNLETGEIEWRKRGFSKSTCIYADGKLILLSEDGQLALATVTPKDMEVHSQAKIFSSRSWSAPTLVGTTLYVRDRKEIIAFDLRA
jgi:outer membrane protein assembly factor BamB